MKKLTLKVIGGLFLGTTTIRACTLGVNQFLKANDNNIYGFYSNQDFPVEKSVALIETEETVREANAKVDAAKEEVQKKTEAKETTVKNLENAKNSVKNEVQKEKAADDEVQKAADDEVQKTVATENTAEETLKNVEEAIKKSETDVAKKATAQQVTEPKPIVEEKAPSVTQSNSTPSIAEDSSPSTEDVVTTIKNAVQKTEKANSLTIRNVKEQWTKEYDKSKGTELIVYYNGSTIPTGVLYSYTNTSNAKQVSLFKKVSTTPWTIPNTNSIKGMTGWEMQFSGKRTVGVIELELVKKLKFLVNATPLATSSLNGDVYKDMGSNIKFYRVAVSNKQFNEWLSTYYSDKLATDTVMIDIGININGYVCYLKARVLGDNKTRNFEIVLANADSTKVPTADELNLNDNDVLELEKAYRKNYGCDIEWAKDKEGKDYYYWVCGPNKHVNQHDF